MVTQVGVWSGSSGVADLSGRQWCLAKPQRKVNTKVARRGMSIVHGETDRAAAYQEIRQAAKIRWLVRHSASC